MGPPFFGHNSIGLLFSAPVLFVFVFSTTRRYKKNFSIELFAGRRRRRLKGYLFQVRHKQG